MHPKVEQYNFAIKRDIVWWVGLSALFDSIGFFLIYTMVETHTYTFEASWATTLTFVFALLCAWAAKAWKDGLLIKTQSNG